MEEGRNVRIVHCSDTHGQHRDMDASVLHGDIFIHTGDFTRHGGLDEWEDFNQWLGSLRPHFGSLLVICGNHEFKGLTKAPNEEAVALFSREDWVVVLQQRLSNARLLHHELVEVEGLKIFGSSWLPWARGANPDRIGAARVYEEVFEKHPQKLPHSWDSIVECDILLTHGPPRGIFDWMEGTGRPWGSSALLRERIAQLRPAAHLFGHLHEQRGRWLRNAQGGYDGGVLYQRSAGERWLENESPSPPPEYPCDLIVCNAMQNHSRLELSPEKLVGAPCVILVARNKKKLTFQLE